MSSNLRKITWKVFLWSGAQCHSERAAEGKAPTAGRLEFDDALPAGDLSAAAFRARRGNAIGETESASQLSAASAWKAHGAALPLARARPSTAAAADAPPSLSLQQRRCYATTSRQRDCSSSFKCKYFPERTQVPPSRRARTASAQRVSAAAAAAS